MIIYYSGTGNSEYVAKRIANETGDRIENLFYKIKNGDHSLNLDSDRLIIVSPTYAWRIPKILNSWLQKANIPIGTDLYFVLTCGTDIGNAKKYLRRFCRKSKLNYRGVLPVVMPENYIALFKTPSDRLARKIIKWADKSILLAIDLLKDDNDFPLQKITIKDRFKSGLVNKLFFPLFVHAKKFKVTNKCVACGKCVSLCPLNNIEMIGGKPIWKDSCTHCMSCINRCPCGAIEYGEESKEKDRYVFPPDLLP